MGSRSRASVVRRANQLLLGALLLGSLLAVWVYLPAAAYSSDAVATAWKAETPVTIDGDLHEWDLSDPQVVLSKNSQVISGANLWDGAADLSGNVYVMWDSANLYVAAVVNDDAPFMSRVGFPPDEADAIGIYLSTDPNANPDRQSYAPTDFRVLLIIDGYDYPTAIDRDMVADPKGIETVGMSGYEQVLEGYEAAATETDDGYVFEACIPFASLANDAIEVLTPVPGMPVGFNVHLADLDMPCPGIAAIQLAWTGTDAIWEVPAEWGVLEFRAR